MGAEVSFPSLVNEYGKALLPPYVLQDVNCLVFTFLPKIVRIASNMNSFATSYRSLEGYLTGKGRKWIVFALIVYFSIRQFYVYYKQHYGEVRKLFSKQ